MSKPTVGGARAGAGRPALPDAKQTVSVRVPPDVRAYLDTVANISEHVDLCVRRSAGFRAWRRVTPKQAE